MNLSLMLPCAIGTGTAIAGPEWQAESLGGVAEGWWRPIHSRGWLDSQLRLVDSTDMQLQP